MLRDLRRFLTNLFNSPPPSTRSLQHESTPPMVTTATADGRPPERFKSFEFSEEDCRVETDSEMIVRKFEPLEPDPSPISKYDFLQCFANGINAKQKNEEIVDVDAGDSSIEAISGTDVSTSSVSLRSNNDNCIESISSAPPRDLAEVTDLPEDQAQGNDLGECVIDSPVIVCADFFKHGDVYSTESQLTFSCCVVKVEGSFSFSPKGPFSFEWAADDIIRIECQWCEMVQTARVTIHFKSEVDDTVTDSSDGDELTFSVFDPNWSEKQKAIKSLNVRYRTRWNLDLDNDTDRRTGVSSDNSFFTNHCSSNSCESSEEFIFPRGDPGAVSVSKRDIDLLKPNTFINDTIIDFYAKYLESKIPPEERHRFYFLNCFFFRKLADLDKDISEVSQGRDAFRRVSRWTRKVNIFEKDYIFLPVNFSLHWSLIVICHPGEVQKIADEQLEKLSKVPCILHMDSLKGSHRGLENLIRSYLCEEWKDRQNQPTEITSMKFSELPFLSLELPQQQNFFDCGLFLLHYMECFISQAPSHFNPFKIAKSSSNFLSKEWFQPRKASRKRAHIRKVIHEIATDDIHKVPPVRCCDRKNPSALPDMVLDNEAELLHATCNATHLNHTKECSSSAGPGTETTTAAASDSNEIMNSSKAALVLCHLSAQKSAQVSPIRDRYQSFEKKVTVDVLKSAMSPIEEAEEYCESAYSPTGSAVGQQAAEGIPSLMPPTFADLSKVLRTSPVPILMLDGDKEGEDSLSATSIGEHSVPTEELLGSCRVNVRDQSGSPSSSEDVVEAHDVMDSEDEESMSISQAGKYRVVSRKDNTPSVPLESDKVRPSEALLGSCRVNAGDQSVSSASSDDVCAAYVVEDSEDEVSMKVNRTEKPRVGSREDIKLSSGIFPIKAPCCSRQEEPLPARKPRVIHVEEQVDVNKAEKSRVVSGKDTMPSGNAICTKDASRRPRLEDQFPLKKRRVLHHIEKSMNVNKDEKFRVGSRKPSLRLRNIVCIKDTPHRPRQEEEVPGKEWRRVIDIED